MQKPVMLGLVLTAFATGCSDGSGEADQRPKQAVVADSVAAPAVAAPHAGHDMGDSASGAETTATAAMDHSAHGSGATKEAANHAGHGGAQGTGHDAAGGRAPAAAGAGGADHSAHAAAPGSARAADPGRPAVDHSRMGHAEAPRPAGSTPAGHAPHAEAEDKLMILVAELVQDTVVQRRIEEDPVLREQWRDPGVRQIILRRR